MGEARTLDDYTCINCRKYNRENTFCKKYSKDMNPLGHCSYIEPVDDEDFIDVNDDDKRISKEVIQLIALKQREDATELIMNVI